MSYSEQKHLFKDIFDRMMCVIYLRSISLKSNNDLSYPFNVANSLVKDTMDFPTPVTFFVGENGSGKSTLLEAIAAGINLPAIGGEAIAYDETLGDIRKLGQHLKLVWNRRTTRGFFMRSEDFFNFTRRIKKLTKELAEEAKAFEEYLTGYGLQLARGSVLGQRQALIENIWRSFTGLFSWRMNFACPKSEDSSGWNISFR